MTVGTTARTRVTRGGTGAGRVMAGSTVRTRMTRGGMGGKGMGDGGDDSTDKGD